MGIKNRLVAMSFLQFFVWGAWLITIANYWFGTKQWEETNFGLVFGTMGIASIFMPMLTGVIADRWVNAERLYGVLHLLYAAILFYIPQVSDPTTFIYVMLAAMCFYMPTIALSNSISYTALKNNNFDVVKSFPPIRVWGTIGFIAAMWITNLTGNKATEYQFYIGGLMAVCLGLYAFTLPKCKPQNTKADATLFEALGFEAFKLFGVYKIALFLIFSMFLGAALQLTNAYGDVFLDEFKFFPKYADSFVVEYSTIIMSISQVSETLFILAIPFFLKRFGIKQVIVISMLAWVLRFGLFSYGNPAEGVWMIVLSCIVYGMAFDFFNISGSLFIETTTPAKIRSSAQGLFMMMTNGFGALGGSYISGWAIQRYFKLSFNNLTELSTYLDTDVNNSLLLEIADKQHVSVSETGLFNHPVLLRDWSTIWLWFALYALVIAIAFAILFKHKHDPKAVANVSH